jgi:TRAP-type C4-dicarboxylate transport system permease large subunit
VSWVFVKEDITGKISETILAITQQPLLVLMLINLFLILLGALLETIPIMVLTIPIFMPLITEIGIDPIHFGILMIVNLMIGSISPPIGMLLFITSRVADLKLEKLMVAILPFLIPLTIVLLSITCFPPLVVWIPNMFF